MACGSASSYVDPRHDDVDWPAIREATVRGRVGTTPELRSIERTRDDRARPRVIDAGIDADAEELRREIDAAAREETTQP